MLWGYIFEISRLEYFLILLFFILFFFTIFRIIFLRFFFKEFYFFYFLIFILITLNLYICLFIEFIFLLLFLLILSFFSLFSIILGYGFSLEVCFIIFFKLLADLFLILYIGLFFFIVGEWEVLIWINFYNCFFFGNLFLFISFSIYSFCSIFGFWIYWAMEGSYFISCYLHSIGFVLISVIIFFKIYYLGLLDDYFFFIYKLEIVFFFSFIFFLFCFLMVKRVKKGFGYFSCSGVCFIFFILLSSPSIGLIYFFFSSFIKIVFFEFLGIFYKFISFDRKFFSDLKSVLISDKDKFSKEEGNLYIYIGFFFVLISISLFFLIYGEFFYFYFCSDIFLDFSFFSSFFGKIIYIFLSLKVFSIIQFLFKIYFIFFKSFFKFFKFYNLFVRLRRDEVLYYFTYTSQRYIGFFSELGVLFFSYLFFTIFLNSIIDFSLEVHFFNFFIWIFLFNFYFFSFYKFFFILKIENSFRKSLIFFFNFFFNKSFFNFNCFKFMNVFSFFNENSFSFFHMSYCFFLVFFLI